MELPYLTQKPPCLVFSFFLENLSGVYQRKKLQDLASKKKGVYIYIHVLVKFNFEWGNTVCVYTFLFSFCMFPCFLESHLLLQAWKGPLCLQAS